MGQRTEGQSGDESTVRVSDALRHEGSGRSLWDRVRRVELWLFVDAHRLSVVGLLALAVFGSIVLAVTLTPPSVMAYLARGTALAKGYVELQTIDVTVITIVLSINQLVLTSEIGSVGQQRSRLDEVLEHRTDVEELAGAPATPTDPEHYLRMILATTRDRVERLRASVGEDDDPALRRGVERYADDVGGEADRVEDALEDEAFGTIELIGAAMHFTTAEEIHAVRRLHEEHEESLSAAQAEAFEDVLEMLKLYTVAREYFRALYVKWEFIDFSRAILYVGLPAVVVAHLTIGFVDGNAFPGTTLGYPNLFWYETAAFTFVLVPVAVVVSYAARLSMLAKASIFVSPFSPERAGGHWEE